jgi:trk system potassium uptake protein TrkH
MKIQYKSDVLEQTVITANGLAAGSVAATFVMLYGFDKPVLSVFFLYAVQVIALNIFLAEKVIRFFNAESKSDFMKFNWFEIPLLALLLLGLLAGRLFAVGSPGLTALITIDGYLVLQVISKLCRSMVSLASTGMSPPRALASVFVVLILSGSGLLMLPRSHNLPAMPFTDAVFTATSAACVTGLTVPDTGSDFTLMGQVVILTLIQMGGLGIVIFGAVIALLLGQALSMRESVAMQDLLSTRTLGRIGEMVAFIFLATLAIEAIGAAGLYSMWDNVPNRYTTPEGKWFCSIFHSVSAFCNAGFGLFKRNLIDYDASAGVYAVIAPLIVLGGLGFGVLHNLLRVCRDRVVRFFHRRSDPRRLLFAKAPERLHLQTKIVLTVSALLILFGALALMLFEHYSFNLQHDNRFRTALFQSVTARTAGFNTIDIASLSEASKVVLILLMFIGGSPGSTAGGIKTVTFAVVTMIVWASFRKRRDVEMFHRSVHLVVVGRAVTVVMMYALVLLISAFGLVITERNGGFSFVDLLFEATSALGTVGLSAGVTPFLTTTGKWIIIVTMLIGRLGPLTLLATMTYRSRAASYEYPSEPLIVG